MFKTPWIRWATVVGFALGGFFDGILLHQILQWHHLLSLVPEVSSLRFQVLWDGYFHALMYVIAAAGLWGLWRARDQVIGRWGHQTLGAILIGFGIWHAIDSVLSHWVLGIHRIKLDSPDPLVWDLIWFFAFGVLPLIVGFLLMRRGTGSPAFARQQRLSCFSACSRWVWVFGLCSSRRINRNSQRLYSGRGTGRRRPSEPCSPLMLGWSGQVPKCRSSSSVLLHRAVGPFTSMVRC